jgi:hypothetical protein
MTRPRASSKLAGTSTVAILPIDSLPPVKVSVHLMPICESAETGQLGVRHLKLFWSRQMAARAGQANGGADSAEWVASQTLICGLGLGLHETLQYLISAQPSFDQFEHWILEKNGGSIEPARIARINAALSGDAVAAAPADMVEGEPPLTPEDLSFWEENGYVILHGAVALENCEAAARAIYEFTGADPANPQTWYRQPQGHSIWIPLLHHPALCANRKSARIHRAFAQLWGRDDMWATVDQGGFNPPERPGWSFPGPFLHWDVSLSTPIPFGVQGILYLTDTDANQGAFTCVPGFHRRIESWLSGLPPGVDPREVNLYQLGPAPIAGKAGDLIIWHQALPHGSSPNRAALPRVVQYLSMRPSQWEYRETWK